MQFRRALYSPTSEFVPLPPDPELLSLEQRAVLELALRGKSLFFTGAAGTGKSFLLQQIIASLRKKGRIVAVTASTGLAALNVDGETLHSFAGVGLGNQDANLVIANALYRKNIKKWSETEVLVIDEISMVDGRWFDIVSEIGRTIRQTQSPFGGMQVIISGDFFQLPPVPEQSYVDAGNHVKFAFQAKDWDKTVPHKIKLTQVFRQQEPELVEMLNEVRIGRVSRHSAQLLRSLSRSVEYNDGIKPVELFPLRILADTANLKEMDKLIGRSIIYTSKDSFGLDIRNEPITPQRGRILLGKQVMDVVELKIGAQVMCIKNITSDIVNGSVGKIVGFMTPAEAKHSEYFIDTIPNSDPDWSRRIYKGPLNLELLSAPRRKIGKKPKNKFIVQGPKFPWPVIETEDRIWPLVQFHNGRHMLVTPVLFSHENDQGDTVACRAQIPLVLAWALTVHKAQGQTLPRVRVDLARTFAPGQAYVGISRCTSLAGLEVLNFSPRVVFAHEAVIKWYDSLTVAHRKKPKGS